MLSSLPAQEANSGLHLPVQVSANGLFTDRFATRLPVSLARLGEARVNSLDGAGGGMRILASPSVRFTERWFAHAAIQLNTEPFFPYEAYHVERRGVRARLVQGYIGYTRAGNGRSLTVKAGQIATAFGDFSRRYSDAANPLIDAPAPYGGYLLLRTNEVPCTNFDLQHQQRVHPNISAYHCAPWESYSYGIIPVTPYGVFGGEVNGNSGRLDFRLQLTNSSPSNPKNIWSANQSAQWAGGAGWSPGKGLRLGGSFFRGRWLDGPGLRDLKAAGVRNSFCACGIGIDAQYAWRRMSFAGEWMRLEYQYPGFSRQPRVRYAYLESKVNLSPRIYFAWRAGLQQHGRVMVGHTAAGHSHGVINAADDPSEPRFQPDKRTLELVAGFRASRHFLFKAGRLWVNRSQAFGPDDHVYAVQLVSILPGIWKDFR